MRLYLEASALAKVFSPEVGSLEVTRLMEAHADAVTCRHTAIEVVSALCRLRRERRLSEDVVAQGVATVGALDAVVATVVELDQQVMLRAMQLLRVHPLRAGDAIQLASALEARADVLVCSDGRLLTAAAAEGLTCVDPTAPPDEAPES